MKKTIISFLMMIGLVMALTGCQSKNEGVANDVDAAFPDAVSVLAEAWNQMPDPFPVVGGNMETAVEDAPASVDLSDTDALTYTFLVPEDVQKDITDAATLSHMMNGNTFTAVAVHMGSMSCEDAAAKIKDKFLGNQFMCGFPDKIKIVSMGSYVIYAYGATDIVDDFMKGYEGLDGASVVADEIYQ